METNSTSQYVALRVWGYVYSIGLTLVCLIAFIFTCTIKMPIIEEGYTIGTKTMFNPVSLIYLFSCIPLIAFGSLFLVVARIGENVQAMKDAKGGELPEEISDNDTTEIDTKKKENRSILYALIGATIILAVAFAIAFGASK